MSESLFIGWVLGIATALWIVALLATAKVGHQYRWTMFQRNWLLALAVLTTLVGIGLIVL